MTGARNLPEVVSPDEWLAARKSLLVREKELTRAHDELAVARRRLPMVKLEKDYRFDGPDGPVSLLELFDGREQLVMHHFMFAPDWDVACASCSSAADQIGNPRQLRARNTNLVAVSRAPFEKIDAYRRRMGWTFPWYSSFGSSFNYDFHATLDNRVAPVLLHFRDEAELATAGTPWTGGPWSEDMNGTEMPGLSAFLRVGQDIYLTYSTFGRGIEEFHNGYPYLDLTALGRQEDGEQPEGRAVPLGREVGGPGLRLPDQYESDSETSCHHGTSQE